MIPDPEHYLPLTETAFYVLLSLTTGSKHGYAILKQVDRMSDAHVVLSTSTLNTMLLRLQDQGLIERVDQPDDAVANPGLPRKLYQLTVQGRRALDAEMSRLRRQVRAGQRELKQGAIE